MKVHEQGNAIIDALAEQYSAEDLPGAFGDVIYDMLVRAADKGAGAHDLHEMLHAVSIRWDGEAPESWSEEPDDYWSEDREAANEWRHKGSGALSGAS